MYRDLNGFIVWRMFYESINKNCLYLHLQLRDSLFIQVRFQLWWLHTVKPGDPGIWTHCSRFYWSSRPVRKVRSCPGYFKYIFPQSPFWFQLLKVNIFCFLSSSVTVNWTSLSCGQNKTFEKHFLTFYRQNNYENNHNCSRSTWKTYCSQDTRYSNKTDLLYLLYSARLASKIQ